MTQALFIQPDVEFEKIAGEVDLSEDPNRWAQEILQELYKQVPYINDFEPQVTMDKVDSERGYGLGQVELSSKTEASASTDPDMLSASGVRTVRIPVVIRERKLMPFDLLINDAGNVLPLTENRARQALFRPQVFDVTSHTPGDQSMIGQLYPPYRQNNGFGGGGMSTMVMGKQGSALEEMLIADLESKDVGFRRLPPPSEKTAAAKPTVPFRKTASLVAALVDSFNKADVDSFFNKLAADPNLQAAYQRNHNAVLGPVGVLANFEPVSQEKRASAVTSLLKPDVVQLTKTHEGYVMKTASVNFWRPVATTLSRRDVVQHFGEKVALAADEAGGVTMTDEPGLAPEEGPLDAEMPETINEPGLYKVTNESDGKELVGFVIPNLLDIDGTPLPLALFTNGSHSAVQPDIVGVPAGEGANLPTGKVSGAGAFFSRTDEGGLQATIPLELDGGSYTSGEEPVTWVGHTFDGRELEVSVQPNIQTVIGTPEGKMLVPDHWQWTPLGAADAVGLLSSEEPEEEAPEDWHESAPEAIPEELEDNAPEAEEPEPKESHVWIRGDHDCFTFTGPAVAKLASADTQMVDLDEAMFLLAALGVEQAYGTTKLAHSFRGPQKVKTAKRIITAEEQEKWAQARALELMPIAGMLRRDLMKEAAVIPDPTAVDTVLSLGFLNPENVMNFVSYLPTIEEGQMKMCDLLLGARVGMDLPTTALERAIRSVEEVLEGLKILGFQG